jgi:hypothetical protein
MSKVHRDITNPYVRDPDSIVVFEGKEYRPVVFTMTKGRSVPIHYIFNYVHDDTNVYFVHKTKSAHQPRLKVLKRAVLRDFLAVHWYVGFDGRYVYHNDRSCPKVKNPAAFHLVDEELYMYKDDEVFYDRYVRVMDVDYDTFEAVPMRSARREQIHTQGTAYWASQGLDISKLTLEHALCYGALALDKNGLYWRNVTIHVFEPLNHEEIAEFCRKKNDDYEDLRCFIKENPRYLEYAWISDLRAKGLI